MGSSKFSWRALKTLSNYALVVVIVIWVLDWYNHGQIELVWNDPIAKSYWLETRQLYERLQWISLALMVGLRVSYWTIGYILDRRAVASSKGD